MPCRIAIGALLIHYSSVLGLSYRPAGSDSMSSGMTVSLVITRTWGLWDAFTSAPPTTGPYLKDRKVAKLSCAFERFAKFYPSFNHDAFTSLVIHSCGSSLKTQSKETTNKCLQIQLSD